MFCLFSRLNDTGRHTHAGVRRNVSLSREGKIWSQRESAGGKFSKKKKEKTKKKIEECFLLSYVISLTHIRILVPYSTLSVVVGWLLSYCERSRLLRMEVWRLWNTKTTQQREIQKLSTLLARSVLAKKKPLHLPHPSHISTCFDSSLSPSKKKREQSKNYVLRAKTVKDLWLSKTNNSQKSAGARGELTE